MSDHFKQVSKAEFDALLASLRANGVLAT